MTAQTRELILRTLQIVLGAVILLSPAAINRSPFVFYDTSHYLQFGRSILAQIPQIGPASPSGVTAAETSSSGGRASSETAKEKDEHASLSYAGGRSPYYSVFVFAGSKLGGFWVIAFVQALIAAWMLWLTLRVFAPPSYRDAKSYFLLVGGLTVLSPLGFYVGMAMPDVMGGLAVLGTALIVFGHNRFTTSVLVTLVLVTAGCAATHATTPVVCTLALIGFALAGFALLGRASFRYANALLLGLTPLVLAIAAGGAFQVATRLALGAAPKSPPYILARLLADGPGRAYLKDACHPEPRYTLCQFEDRKFSTQDEFLWSGKPDIGVFSITDYSTRTALQAEELSFAWGTFSSYPLWQMQKFAEHWLWQLKRFGLSEFDTAVPSWNEMAFEETVPELGPTYRASLAYQGKFPLAIFEWMQWIGIISSLALVAYWISRPQTWAAVEPSAPTGSAWTFWIVAAGGLFVVMVGNALLCGALSGVNDRYQARLIWLVPLFAVLVGAHMRAAQRSRSGEQSPGEDPSGLVLQNASERR